MAHDLPFVDDLKLALTQLGDVQKSLAIKLRQKDILREKIKAWMQMNKLSNFEIIDNDNFLWRLAITSSNRRSANFDYLESILTPQQYSEAVKTTASETFKCNTVKSGKVSSGGGKRAPTATKIV